MPINDQLATATPLERRLARRLVARGEDGLIEALLDLKGVVAGERYRFDSIYAMGGQGAVFDCTDVRAPGGPPLVAKVILSPVHRPFELDSNDIRRKRNELRIESQYLVGNSSPFMPSAVGVFEFMNPMLDEARGEAFAETEPVLVMEKLPGRDLDRWLARTHRADVPQAEMRRTLDRIAVVLVQALTDLRRRGLLYADLRPANMRMMGRPQRRVRMLDAGSLVAITDKSGRFPHVPAYLPPDLFDTMRNGALVVPTDAIQAVMAGRTLYEAATGDVPRPGQQVDLDKLDNCNVSDPVAEVVRGLCEGRFRDARVALRFLQANASRRVTGANTPGTETEQPAPAAKRNVPEARPISRRAGSARPKAAKQDEILPPSKPKGFFARLLGRIFGK